jgi:cupin-like protein
MTSKDWIAIGALPRTGTAPSHVASPGLTADPITVLQWGEIDRSRYIREHLNGLKPAIVRGALDQWPARNKWTPQFFADRYGDREIVVDGVRWRLAALIERILTSTPEAPAPYLRNQRLADWPRELTADISPLPACARPNYLESPLFPSRENQTALELYIGGAGAVFPTLHYDFRHTHAFLMQLYGTKEYLVFAPDQARCLYPRPAPEANKSSIPDIENVDLARFPLYAQARGTRFVLNAGETLFVPGGWWHTARILTTSITVSINGATSGNWLQYRQDYCASVAQRSRIRAALLAPYLDVLGVLLSIFET